MNARHRIGLATPIALALWALPAYAQNAQQAGGQSDQEPGRTGHAVNDEIQVYNAEIAKVGQWTIQFHNNYAINGRKEPDFEGGIIPNHALNATPELAYGITESWEIGFYAPYAVDQNGQVAVIRHAQCRPAVILLWREFRIELRHAALFRNPVESRDQADYRFPQGRL